MRQTQRERERERKIKCADGRKEEFTQRGRERGKDREKQIKMVGERGCSIKR